VLILDEPTAALETREIERLFAVLARMKRQGTAIIYVSHRLDEIVALADRCTVLRDGRVAATSRRGSFNVTDLVAAMTGGGAANAEGLFPAPLFMSADQPEPAPRAALLEDVADRPDAIRLRAREVTGLAGLLGSGASGILRRLFGIGGEARQAPARWHSAAARQSGGRGPRRHRFRARRAPAGSRHEPFGARQHFVAESRPAEARSRRPH
jgi:ribose transport system ATP-binding protein